MSEPIPVPRPDGVQAPAVPLQSSIAPGWYPDPGIPGSERRWDGSSWVGTPHRSPNPKAIFGPDYARAYWFNANRILHVTRIAGIVSLLTFAGYLVIGNSYTTIGRPGGLLALFSIVGVVAGVAGIVTGGIGITRARQLGGLVPAITMVIGNALMTLLNLALFAFVALTVTYGT